MATLKPLKLVMTYDILCPHSWVAYQILQKKLPNWRRFRGFDVEYKPAMHPLIHRLAHGVKPAGVIAAKKNYFLNELYELCDLYTIPKGNFEVHLLKRRGERKCVVVDISVRHEKMSATLFEAFPNFGQLENRSIGALLLLLKFKQFLPHFYEPMMRAMWQEFWHRSGRVHRTSIYLRLGREIGVPFRVMDDIVMHVEERENYVQLSEYNKFLVEDERITGCPWFTLSDSVENRKLMIFDNAIRLEFLDELVLMADAELDALAPVAAEEPSADDLKEDSLNSTGEVSDVCRAHGEDVIGDSLESARASSSEP